MNVLDVQKKCVGCGACADVCPVDSFYMVQDEYGFYIPQLKNDKCIGCGKCVKICPAIEPNTQKQDARFFYGWILNDDIRYKSSSGGAFSAMAQHIIDQQGVVFGAKYTDDFKSIEMASTQECSLDDLRRSKYCQSFSANMYNKIAQNLKDGKKVMVVGTPCQIATARKIFKNNENLLLVDFICGGVTSQKAYENYINYIEKKYKSNVTSINMRSKANGWSKSTIAINFENGKKYTSRYQFDYYYHYFYNGIVMKNEPCITCLYTNHCDADITIADFWGYKNASVVNDDKGISLIGAYTQKGQEFVFEFKDKMALYPLENKYASYAYYEKIPSKADLAKRDKFINMLKEYSFVEAAKKDAFKYGKVGILLKNIIHKVVRK